MKDRTSSVAFTKHVAVWQRVTEAHMRIGEALRHIYIDYITQMETRQYQCKAQRGSNNTSQQINHGYNYYIWKMYNISIYIHSKYIDTIVQTFGVSKIF